MKLRVISTPAGMNNKFYELWNEAPDFKRHKTSVYDAVDQGLALDIDELKANLADPDGWAQEFECQFMEHAAQVFPVDLIHSVEDSKASFGPWENRTPNPLFVGIDIGRRKDLTVAWTLERVDGVLWTREIQVLENIPFPEQEAILAERVNRARFVAIDSTGIGGPVSEHLAKRLGDYKLESVNFTNERKRELFSRAKKSFQSQKVRIPNSAKLRDDLGSIQRIVTPQGLVKFIAARTRDGHADRATALALALHAAEKQPEGFGLSQINPARVGDNRRRVRPMRTRFPQGTDLQIISGSTPGVAGKSEPTERLMALADRACDLLFLGQTLTSEEGSSGSYALGSVHREVELDLYENYAAYVIDVVNNQLIPSIIELNWGNSKELPFLEVELNRAEKDRQLVERDKMLFKDMGLPVAKQWLYDRHKVPAPGPDEDLFDSGGSATASRSAPSDGDESCAPCEADLHSARFNDYNQGLIHGASESNESFNRRKADAAKNLAKLLKETDLETHDLVWSDQGHASCPICSALNGTTYPDGWTTPPPIHHNCDCVIEVRPKKSTK